MTNTELTTLITQALATDANILDWSQTHFSKEHLVFDGIDAATLPEPPDAAAEEQGDYPFIAIDIDEQTTGQAVEAKQVTLALYAALIDPSPYTQEEGSRIKLLPGKIRREEFHILIMQSIKAALAGHIVSEVKTVNDLEAVFPQFGVYIVLAVESPYGFREDRFI